ncbi:MAG: dipeptidase [Henriciella sp.]|jgi:membrane dipeptidase
MTMRILTLASCLVLAGACAERAQEDAGSQIMVPSSHDRAARLHQDLMVMDSHLDTPAYFHRADYTFSDRGSWAEDGTNVDLPRMNDGGLDGGFWVIYTAQGPLTPEAYSAARDSALMRQAAIREFAARYADEVELAFTAEDAGRIHDAGKKIVYQSIENAYPLGEDLSLMETFYIGGVRMISPAHFRNNQFADSATDVSAAYDGLSPLGEDLVREANRLGMILDGSHAADSTVYDMIDLSTTPIILSHSGPKGVYDHPRNVPDELLRALAESGGVIQVNGLGSYLEKLEPTPERAAALAALEAEFGGNLYDLSPQDQIAYRAAREELNEAFPPPRSSFEMFMTHLLYTLELVGPDHVGLGADWDGGGGVDGMEDVSHLPKVTARLLQAGYSEDDLAKIWGGNMVRLLSAAEAAREAALTSPPVTR